MFSYNIIVSFIQIYMKLLEKQKLQSSEVA